MFSFVREFGSKKVLLLIFASFLFLLQFMPSLTKFKFGAFRQIDPSYGGFLILVGGLSLLFLITKTKFKELLNDTLIQNFWVFAILTLLLSVFHPYPLRNLFGTAQIYDGLLLFIAAGLGAFFIRQLIKGENTEGPFLWSCLIIGSLYCLLIILTEKDSPFILTKDWFYKPFVFNDFFGFIALSFIPLSERLIQKYQSLNTKLITVTITSALIYYASNWTMLFGIFTGLVFVIFWHFMKIKWLYRYRYVAFPLGIVAIALGIVSYVWLATKFNLPLSETLKSRCNLLYVTIAHYLHAFSWADLPHILFGNGWDSYQNFATSNIYLINDMRSFSGGEVSIGWEYAERDLINSHNALFEFFTSLGVVGAVTYIYTQYRLLMVVNFKLKTCQIFIVSLGVLTSGWYQFINMLPFTLVGLVLCTSGQPIFSLPKFSEKIQKRFVAISSSFCIIGGVAFLIISTSANQLTKMVSYDEIPELTDDFLNSKTLKIDHHLRSLYHSRTSDYFAQIHFDFFKERAKPLKDKKPLGKFNDDNAERILGSMVKLAKDVVSKNRHDNILSILNILRLYDSLFVEKEFMVFLEKSSHKYEIEKFYEEIVKTIFAKYHLRVDMAQGYMGHLFDTIQHGKLEETAKHLSKIYPNHVIGDYFMGLVLISRDDMLSKTKGFSLLKKSVNGGVGRYMPIDDKFLRSLNLK